MGSSVIQLSKRKVSDFEKSIIDIPGNDVVMKLFNESVGFNPSWSRCLADPDHSRKAHQAKTRVAQANGQTYYARYVKKKTNA
jgi:hypothetical protein